MPKPSAAQQLYDPRQGTAAIRVQEMPSSAEVIDPPRTNYFSIYWIESGHGTFWADAAKHEFTGGSLLFFTPYQHIRLVPETAVYGKEIQFHANFLCVETFHAETGCAGTLFNDPYSPPLVTLTRAARREVWDVVQRMWREQTARPPAYDEMLLAQLKMLLILAARAKVASLETCTTMSTGPRHPVLSQLKQCIEEHYAIHHAPSDYARMLHMSPKTLGRIVREQLGKSLTDLIRERILIHAKWQLLHTLKPVKEVAREIGFSDELYFSRMFKKATGYSPSFFREFETEIRGGSNLSMLSRPAPIQASRPTADNSGR